MTATAATPHGVAACRVEMTTTARKSLSELSSSFGEADAHAFARFFRHHTSERAEVSQLHTPFKNEPTNWYRVAVPKRSLGRAEDMRAAWEASATYRDDARWADRIAEWNAEDAARVERGSVRVVGLTTEARAFLEATGDSARKVTGFDAGPSTVASAKKHGWIAAEQDGRRTIYRLTDAGREILSSTA